VIRTTVVCAVASGTDDSCAGHAEEPSLALVTRRPWRVTVRRMNHRFPTLFDTIGSFRRRACRTKDLRESERADALHVGEAHAL
jgi:hypothetical protein